MVLIPQVGPVAWWAHIGGLVAGALLVIIMRRPGVPLFDRGRKKRDDADRLKTHHKGRSSNHITV